MSTLNPPSKITPRTETGEDRASTFYLEAWDFFDRHRTAVYATIAVIAVGVLAIVGWTYYHAQQVEEAEQLLGQIVGTYEAGNYEEALQGTGDLPGLLTIAEEYGGTPAGNMAHFYAADALYATGQKEQALEHWEAFEKEETILGASAYAGMAAVNEDLGNYERAGDFYLRAAAYYESDVTSPLYLLQAARAYEAAAAYEQAQAALEQLEEEYPDSPQAAQVPVAAARIEAKQNA